MVGLKTASYSPFRLPVINTNCAFLKHNSPRGSENPLIPKVGLEKKPGK